MMGNNERKLLPYEYQLIESLGISKEEYLDFVAQQHIYTDIKEGTALDVRNAVGVVALVLTIVGTILQVVAALIAPAPEKPKGQRQQTRDDVFAPRLGFNNIQELAKYGDPVNLIYTNTDVNSSGGVRVGTSLLWSAVKSFGSSQYVQLLLLLGAGGIGRIEYQRTAFGQTPIRDLVAQNYWLYFRENSVGAIRGTDLRAGGEGKDDPLVAPLGAVNPYRIFPSITSSAGDGFSHALSPATSNTFGSYGPVPINVDIIIRKASGDKESIINGIDVSGLAVWGPNAPNATNGTINEGEQLVVTIKTTASTAQEAREARKSKAVAEEAADHRRSLASVFDSAGSFKFGSAKFSVISVSNGSTDEGDVVVRLRCVEAGLAPSVTYTQNSLAKNAQQLAEFDLTYIDLKRTSRDLLDEDERTEITSAKELLADGRIFRLNNGKYSFKRNLTEAEKIDLQAFIDYEQKIASSPDIDEQFFTKALVKIETAAYESISPCHIVDLAIRAKVFRRISGRQDKYGTDEKDGYRVSDNGIKVRSAMFLLKYKASGESVSRYVKGVFVVRRSSDVDNYVYLKFNSGNSGLSNARHWTFELEPVHDPVAEIKSKQLNSGGSTNFFYLENSGSESTISLPDNATIGFIGNIRASGNMVPPQNRTPEETNEWDMFSNTADTQLQMSFDNGPEFVLTAVTEQIIEPFTNFPGLYEDLSLVGFNMYSGRNVQDLRSLSMFVTQGRFSRLLRTSGTVNNIAWGQPGFEYLPAVANGYANTAPDIFVDTIIDRNDGIGKYAGDLFSVDVEQLARSKKFCETNLLFMDGIIAEPTSWRQFWADNSAFSLLELAKRDGKETLIPGVPYNPTTGQIVREITVTALFNQGNILEDSYKEEFIDYGSNAEDVIVTAIYRDNESNGAFPRNNSVEVRLTDANEEVAIRETIDLSRYVTQKPQAILVAKFLCQTRRHSRRAIEFKTFPTDSLITPGGFIYVELAQNQWNGIESGSIGEGGVLNLPLAKRVADGTYQVLLYNPGNTSTGTLFRTGVSVTNNTASSLATFVGHVFVLGTAIRNKRVFRVTEVSMDEEGEVTVRGIEHPTDSNGLSLISNGLSTRVAGLFTIDGRSE